MNFSAEIDDSNPELVPESGLEFRNSVLESVVQYCNALLGLVLEFRMAVRVLGLDLRLPVLGLDSYSAAAILVIEINYY
jgi:hypothetical protein